mmetsp:Transcript_41712/g.50792  ORF Transcript_41712/g.50792 Transcript_41712/m.50792 type:complete len:392 (-) Transcript_41712:125-1300(-)
MIEQEQELHRNNNPAQSIDEADEDLEWEEWDGSSPFLHHCVAGSIAGVAEHTLLYPMDTIKTHMQSYCAECPHNKAGTAATLQTPAASARLVAPQTTPTNPNMGMLRTTHHLLYSANNPSSASYFLHSTSITAPSSSSAATIPPQFLRLFRGVQTMFVGCVPAHALYFSSYEIVKSTSMSLSPTHTLSPLGASLAGGTATLFHDVIMTPLDTIKQRLQLGHYRGMGHAFYAISRTEGIGALYRSFPITLATNVPYGMVMVSVNEGMKTFLRPHSGSFDVSTSIIAGSVAGFVASALTTPLDRIKTRLQTQRLGSVSTLMTRCEKGVDNCVLREAKFEGMGDAIRSILRNEGIIGLWRGWIPRVMTHTPAVAICWTSYEGVKSWLKQHWNLE